MTTKERILSLVAAVVLALLFLLSFPFAASAEVAEPPSAEEAAAVLFIHLESGVTVFSKAETENVGAGSAVKALSGLLLCELSEGHGDESVTVTENMLAPAAGRSMGLADGDVIDVDSLLYAAVCGSYNDAYYVLAAYFCGSHDSFVKTMNLRAAELGATSSNFTDLSGLVAGSRTTARDMAKIALAAYENERYMSVADAGNYDFYYREWNQKTGKHDNTHYSVYNWNAMISAHYNTKYYNSRCRGVSAGSASEGNSVLTVAIDKTNAYLCVVLCGKEEKNDEGGTDSYGYIIANRLISWGVRNFSYTDVLTPESEICTVPVTVSDTVSEIPLRTDETISAFLPKGLDTKKDLRVSIRLNSDTLEAPVEEGQFVGYATVLYEDRVLGTVRLYTAGSAARSSFIGNLQGIKNLTKSRAVRAGGIFFVVTIAGWIITETLVRKKKKQKWEKYFADKNARR